jgi:hypothetical protein
MSLDKFCFLEEWIDTSGSVTIVLVTRVLGNARPVKSQA